MPRQSRLDAPGVLQHVIVRGIEKRKIFLDETDRLLFITRLSSLLTSTETECLAWALIPNHFHLLLRSGASGLASFMRRLLTGYAISFNKRHNRVGHLFQNRYKSIVCEEDTYLLELVRYIHLNPLRARIVSSLDELDCYPWSGHAVLVGNHQMDGQVTADVLGYFGESNKRAVDRYRQFVEEGMTQGRRSDLTGGGLRRSQGQLQEGQRLESYDERVLGSGDFVEYLRTEKNLKDRLPRGLSLAQLVERVADYYGLSAEALVRSTRMPRFVEARGVVCYLGVRELEKSGAEVGLVLNMKRSGVCLAARRGEEIIRRCPDIIEKVLGG